jgi:hypothetical protein
MKESGGRLKLFKDDADAKAAYLEALEDADTCDHILDMEKMVDVNGWISVKDRLPTQNGPILMWSRRLEDVPTCAAAGYELWNWSAEYSPHDYRLFDVTHWQELPEPPKEEK